MQRVFSLLVDNNPGVLSRVSGLFSRRGYSIDSITAGTTADPRFTRITVVASGDELILSQIENAKEELAKPFDFEDELKEKTERLNALNIELNLDQKDPAVLDAEPEETNELPERKAADRER